MLQKIFYGRLKSVDSFKTVLSLESCDMSFNHQESIFENPYRISFNHAICFLGVIRTWFNVRYVSLILEKLSSAQNMFVSAIENFYGCLKSVELFKTVLSLESCDMSFNHQESIFEKPLQDQF